jgi:hypothetical protein
MMTIMTNWIKVTKGGTSSDGALCCELLFVDTESTNVYKRYVWSEYLSIREGL